MHHVSRSVLAVVALGVLLAPETEAGRLLCRWRAARRCPPCAPTYCAPQSPCRGHVDRDSCRCPTQVLFPVFGGEEEAKWRPIEYTDCGNNSLFLAMGDANLPQTPCNEGCMDCESRSYFVTTGYPTIDPTLKCNGMACNAPAVPSTEPDYVVKYTYNSITYYVHVYKYVVGEAHLGIGIPVSPDASAVLASSVTHVDPMVDHIDLDVVEGNFTGTIKISAIRPSTACPQAAKPAADK